MEFDNGEVLEYAVNTIAENLYSQIDEEGFQQVLIDEIIDHRKEKHAGTKENGFVEIKGKQIPKRTQQGWKLCNKWENGWTSWEWLSDMKEGHPVKTTEYALNKDLMDDPAFQWWAPYTIHWKDRIIPKIKARYQKRMHKFRIELPTTVMRALEINMETGTT